MAPKLLLFNLWCAINAHLKRYLLVGGGVNYRNSIMNLKHIPFLLVLATACNGNDRNEKEHLRQQNALQKIQNTELETAAAGKLAQSEAKATAFTQDIATAEASIKSLETRLRDTTDSKSALEGEKAQIEADKLVLEAQLADKQKNFASLQDTLTVTEIHEQLLVQNVDTLTADIGAKKQSIRDLDERIKNLTLTDSQVVIIELNSKLDSTKKELAELTAAKATEDSELAQKENVILTSLAPLWGMYHSRNAFLTFDGIPCQQFVYVRDNGDSINAVVCEDGSTQWNQLKVQGFAAVNESALDGKLGFQLTSSAFETSCKAPSLFESGLVYAFDRGSSFGVSDLAPSLTTTMNGKPVVLDSASIDYNSNECEDLLALAESRAINGPQQSQRLDMMVRVCKLVMNLAEANSSMNTGCFTSPTTFTR